MRERRKYIRIAPSRPVEVKFKMISHRGRSLALKRRRGTPRNISGGGMFVEMPRMKPKTIERLLSGKYKFALELKIPGYRSKIKILSKAAWVDKKKGLEHNIFNMGIQFEKIKEIDRERLVTHMLDLLLQ